MVAGVRSKIAEQINEWDRSEDHLSIGCDVDWSVLVWPCLLEPLIYVYYIYV